MKSLRLREILSMKGEGQTLRAEGWIKTLRTSGSVIFVELSDGSCMRNLQIVVPRPSEAADTLSNLGTGAAIACEGVLVASQGKGQSVELQGQQVEVFGNADSSYPLQKKRHSFEFLREIAHLRPRTNTIGAVARVRSTLAYAIHTYFVEHGFAYVHTPIITGSDAEGAGKMFQVTTLDLDEVAAGKHTDKESGKVAYNKDFFTKKTHLSVSGQLNGEAYALALRDIYTFGPTFRAENSNTPRHLAEFWMVEPEMAFCTLEGDMQWAEDFLKFIFKYVLDHCAEDMEFFNKWIEPGIIEKVQNVINTPFVHMTYTEAVDALIASKKNFEFPVSWGVDLQTEHERYLTEELHNGPVIVTDYPKGIKAFYMKLNDDNETVRGMDVLVPRLGEIIGGSEREADYDTLLRRIGECGMDPKDYEWYLDLRRYGSVPHAGFGLGFARALLYITGVQNIREAIPFPRYSGHSEF